MSARDRSALAAFFVLGWRQQPPNAPQRSVASHCWRSFCSSSGQCGAPHRSVSSGSDRLTVEQLFWYLAATEAVAMCVGYPYRNVEADIQSGELASSLVRPVHYALATLVNWIGETTERFIAVLGASIVCGILATKTPPVDALTGVLLIAALWVNSVMLLLWQFCIGLLSTWMMFIRACLLGVAETVLRAGRPDDSAHALSDMAPGCRACNAFCCDAVPARIPDLRRIGNKRRDRHCSAGVLGWRALPADLVHVRARGTTRQDPRSMSS